ncbi:hypothetical protein FOMPIDRAFT_1033882 [Fomitopsis schrenkii]|uniref:Endonuclease/exonuclease/phosphatase domain-containing protein n=1 Tax=Fomitopsis schrenkii TaxID=2126942 RepID=S8DNF9_FOMSC|nr:hypothetical protein FOMPIDRAFT_1033882 [Fomitopsis schrenkii]
MSGRGSLYSLDNKWTALSQTMREKKLGIMALQETHLPPEDVETVHKMYGKRIRLVNSPDPTNASGARGVAIALNRELVDISDVTSHVLVPGRALIVRTKWHNDKYITIMNIYALNDVAANEEFWAAIENALDNPRVPKPDVLLGDFNLVEEAIDRLPMKDSTPGAVEALQSLLGKLHLHDGWRITEPSCCDYTFPQRGSTTRSRLDRIYVSQDVLNRSYEWRIESTNIPTDHRLVSVQLTAAEAPYIGKGTRTEERNPQLMLRNLKDTVRTLARDTLKSRIPKLKAAIKAATKALSSLQNSRSKRGQAPCKTRS